MFDQGTRLETHLPSPNPALNHATLERFATVFKLESLPIRITIQCSLREGIFQKNNRTGIGKRTDIFLNFAWSPYPCGKATSSAKLRKDEQCGSLQSESKWRTSFACSWFFPAVKSGPEETVTHKETVMSVWINSCWDKQLEPSHEAVVWMNGRRLINLWCNVLFIYTTHPMNNTPRSQFLPLPWSSTNLIKKRSALKHTTAFLTPAAPTALNFYKTKTVNYVCMLLVSQTLYQCRILGTSHT